MIFGEGSLPATTVLNSQRLSRRMNRAFSPLALREIHLLGAFAPSWYESRLRRSNAHPRFSAKYLLIRNAPRDLPRLCKNSGGVKIREKSRAVKPFPHHRNALAGVLERRVFAPSPPVRVFTQSVPVAATSRSAKSETLRLFKNLHALASPVKRTGSW